jgi:hypothetical protein
VWCPSCLTVLAREQTEVAAGGAVCERCSTPVTERQMRQWFLRTTAYAERLLAGLDDLDWPERAKRLQRQWIGRSEGREVDFGDLCSRLGPTPCRPSPSWPCRLATLLSGLPGPTRSVGQACRCWQPTTSSRAMGPEQ